MANSAAARSSAAPLGRRSGHRQRILDAAVAVAAKGGYEAVQMRTVAQRAEVAVGTLYLYFPSKVHLLVCALGREFERLDAGARRAPLHGATPYQRLHHMVDRLNRAMRRNPLLTEAMARAFVLGDGSAAAEVNHVGSVIETMLARAISGDEPTAEHHQIARVIGDVWLFNLLAWLTRAASTADVNARLETTMRLLLSEDTTASSTLPENTLARHIN